MDRDTLKSYFLDGESPTASNFSDLIDAFVLTTEVNVDSAAYSSLWIGNPNIPTKGAVGAQFATIDTALSTKADLDSGGKLLLSQIPSSLTGGLTFQGLWNAATNSPAISGAGTQGFYYKVSVAGTNSVTGTSINWNVGDWIISDGTTWSQLLNSDSTSTVFGRTGNIVAQTGDYNFSQISGALTSNQLTLGVGLEWVGGNTLVNTMSDTSQLTNGAGFLTLTSLSASTPLNYDATSGIFSIQQASTNSDGYLSQADWNTFNNKSAAFNFDATPTSGSSNLVNSGGVYTALQSYQPSLGFTPENAVNKGVANGYASLDSGGKVPASQLPSLTGTYVDLTSTQTITGVKTIQNTLAITETSNSAVGLTIQGNGSAGNYTQTADLTQWQSYNGTSATTIAKVDNNGTIYSNNFSNLSGNLGITALAITAGANTVGNNLVVSPGLGTGGTVGSSFSSLAIFQTAAFGSTSTTAQTYTDNVIIGSQDIVIGTRRNYYGWVGVSRGAISNTNFFWKIDNGGSTVLNSGISGALALAYQGTTQLSVGSGGVILSTNLSFSGGAQIISNNAIRSNQYASVTTGQAISIFSVNAIGTNIAGGNITIQGGAGTGTGTASQLIFQGPLVGTSGTTTQSIGTLATMDSTNGTKLLSTNNAQVGISIQGFGASSSYTQTADLTEWNSFNGTATTIIGRVDKSGYIGMKGYGMNNTSGSSTAGVNMSYFLSNSGSTQTAILNFDLTAGANTAGVLGLTFDNANGLGLTAGNGTKMISRWRFSLQNLVNTAGSESSDLQLLAQNSTDTFIINSQIKNPNWTGTTARMLTVDQNGYLQAIHDLQTGQITNSTLQGYLTTVSNWSNSGSYTGTALTNTYQGQWYDDSNYWYFLDADNAPVRLPKSHLITSRPLNTITANTTLDATYSIVLCNGTFTVTLPSVSSFTNQEYTIKNIGTGTVTIGGTVDGVSSKTLSTQYQWIIVKSDGTNWYQIG